MPEKQVKIRGITYYEGEGLDRVARFAHQGQKVDLPADEVKRIEAIYEDRDGVEPFGDPSENPTPPAASTASNAVDMSDDELDDYLESNSPNVAETVALAGDDPESAQRVLDAENRVSDGEPRQGVEDGLTKIIEGDK